MIASVAVAGAALPDDGTGAPVDDGKAAIAASAASNAAVNAAIASWARDNAPSSWSKPQAHEEGTHVVKIQEGCEQKKGGVWGEFGFNKSAKWCA